MVKKLADELNDILDWIANPGLGEHAKEEAQLGLEIFCRGLVCGLRFADVQSKEECPMTCEEHCRRCNENSQLHPVGEYEMGNIPTEKFKDCLKY